MQSGLDRADGGLLGRVRDLGETPTQDAHSGFWSGDDLARFDPCRREEQVDAGVLCAIVLIPARDGQVEREFVVLFAVDGDGVGCVHMD